MFPAGETNSVGKDGTMNEKIRKVLIGVGIGSVVLNVALICGIAHFAGTASESAKLAERLQAEVGTLTAKINAGLGAVDEIERGNSDLKGAITGSKDLVGQISGSNSKLRGSLASGAGIVGQISGENQELRGILEASSGVLGGIKADNGTASGAIGRSFDLAGNAEAGNSDAEKLIRECIELVESDSGPK